MVNLHARSIQMANFYVLMGEMKSEIKKDSLCLSSLRLLGADVLLDRVVEDGFDAERAQPVDGRFDGHLVLAGHKVAVEGALHEPVEQPLAHDFLAYFHNLKHRTGIALEIGECARKKFRF
jgi:hypothetical protein